MHLMVDFWNFNMIALCIAMANWFSSLAISKAWHQYRIMHQLHNVTEVYYNSREPATMTCSFCSSRLCQPNAPDQSNLSEYPAVHWTSETRLLPSSEDLPLFWIFWNNLCEGKEKGKWKANICKVAAVQWNSLYYSQSTLSGFWRGDKERQGELLQWANGMILCPLQSACILLWRALVWFLVTIFVCAMFFWLAWTADVWQEIECFIIYGSIGDTGEQEWRKF